MKGNTIELDKFIIESVNATPDSSENDEATVSEESEYSFYDEQNESILAGDQPITLENFINNSIKVTADFSENDSIHSAITNIKEWINSQSNKTSRINYDNYFSLLANLFNLLKNAEKLDEDQSNTLIAFYLQEMADTEEVILEQDDPMMFRYLMNRDKLKSLTGEFILFSIPKLSNTKQDELFRFFLEVLRKSEGNLLPTWVYEHSIMILSQIMGIEKIMLILEIYIKKLEENVYGHSSYHSLQYLLLNFCSSGYRFNFFTRLRSYLAIYGQSRAKQENLQYFFTMVYNNLETKQEQQQILNEIILPMEKSENIYLRKSLAEMLVKLESFPDNGEKILERLINDKNKEVRLLATNAKSNLKRLAKTELSSSNSSDTQPDSYVLDIKLNQMLIDQHTTTNSPPVDTKQKLESDLQNFKKSIKPQNAKQERIKGVNNQNKYIREYCWISLKSHYLGRLSSEEEKIKFINIIFEAFKKENFIYSEYEFIDYIFWELRPIATLSTTLIKKILNLLGSHININFREWSNLLNSLFFENIDHQTIKNVIEVYENIIINGKRTIPEKKIILLNITSIQYFCNDYLTIAIPALIKISNQVDPKLREFTYNILYDQLSDIPDVDHLKPELFHALEKIHPNNFSQPNDLVEQLLGFFVYVIAASGNNPRGKCAINVLFNIIESSSTRFTAFFIDKLLKDYGVNSLVSLDKLNNLIKSKQQNTTKHKLIYEELESLIEKGKFDKAEEIIKSVEEQYLFYPLITFFKAEIKFQKKLFSEAIGLYKDFLKTTPFFIKAKIKLSQCYENLNAFYAKKQINDEIITMSPQLELEQKSIFQKNENTLTLENSIAYAERDLEQYIKNSLHQIHTYNISDDQRKPIIKKSFTELKNNFILYFGKNIVEKFFESQNEEAIDWNDLISYPHQFPRFMRDIFMGLLHLVLPVFSIRFYKTYQESICRMKSIDEFIKQSKIMDFVEDDNPIQFLKDRFNTTTAYDFIEGHAFTNKLMNSCALGLSADVSSAYSLLTGILKLKHWELVYEEVGVEPSGTTQHTNEFLDKVLQRVEPIVMFVPVIVKTSTIDNPTLDEIKFIIKLAKTKPLTDKIFLVFGAYDFLPIYTQCIDPITRHRSPSASFKKTLDHILKFYNIKIINKSTHYQDLMQHMLETQLKINIIASTPEDITLHKLFKDAISDFFSRKIDFIELLELGVKKFPKLSKIAEIELYLYEPNDWKNFDDLLSILDAILFNNMPWFNSSYQLPDTRFAIELKEKLEGIKQIFNTDFKKQVVNLNPLDSKIELISKFLSYLNALISNIELGLQWKGISDFQFSSLSRKNNRSQNQQLYKSTQLPGDKAKPSALSNKSIFSRSRKMKTREIIYEEPLQITPCKTAPKTSLFSGIQSKLNNDNYLKFLKEYFRKATVTLDVSEEEYLLQFDNRKDCDEANNMLYKIENPSKNTWERLPEFYMIRVQVSFIPKIVSISSKPISILAKAVCK